MNRLLNNPEQVVDEMLAGYIASYPDRFASWTDIMCFSIKMRRIRFQSSSEQEEEMSRGPSDAWEKDWQMHAPWEMFLLLPRQNQF